MVTPDGALRLDFHSHINGYRCAGAVYTFVPGKRLLTEMVPRCIKLACLKMKPGTVYEHPCGLRTTSDGWPLPADDETSLGRWHVRGSRLHIDLKENTGGQPYVRDGDLGLLVTDTALRGSFYKGTGPVGKLGISRHVLAFYWPYSEMSEPTVSYYRDDRRQHMIIEDHAGDGHLGLQGITKPKSDKADAFLSPVFSMKNRLPELFEQVCQAHAQYQAAK